MRFARTFVIAFLSLALTVFLPQPARPGGQTPTSAPQGSPRALTLLQQSLAALTGGKSITDITLSGTARRIAGSDDESGTGTLKALAGTGSRLDLTLPSGPRSEIRNTSAAPIVGSWSGPDGIPHSVTYHNLVTDPGWAPAFTIASLLSAQNATITYIGPETRDGQSVIHISSSQTLPFSNPPGGTTFQHLSQVDFYLDSSIFLPAAISFNIHPDSNELVDIPVQVQFSDYRAISGAEIPFHIQKFINNTLALDLRFTSATLNSGLSAGLFNAQ